MTGRPSRPGRAPRVGEELQSADQPFTLLGGSTPFRWVQADSATPVTWYINTSAASPLTSGDAATELQKALSGWTAPPSASIILQYGGTTFQADADGPFTGLASAAGVITFEDPNNEISGSVLAIGGGWAGGSGGTVNGTVFSAFTRGYVIFQNAADLSASFRTPPNFTRVLEHEIGHAIGLGHTQTDGVSVAEPAVEHHVSVVLRHLDADAAGDRPRRSRGADLHLSIRRTVVHLLDRSDVGVRGRRGEQRIGNRDDAGRLWLDRHEQLGIPRHQFRQLRQQFGQRRLHGVRQPGAVTKVRHADDRRPDVHRESGGRSVQLHADAHERERHRRRRQRIPQRVRRDRVCVDSDEQRADSSASVSGSSGSGNGSVSYSVTANGVSARSGTLTVGGQTFTVNQFGTGPMVTVDRPALRYGATNSGFVVTAQTSAQIVRLTQTSGAAVSWTATSNQPWLMVSPTSGSGAGELSVTVAPAGLATPGTVTGTITFALTGAGNTLAPVNVTLVTMVTGTSVASIGVIDTPLANATGVVGAIPVTGWALDDVEVANLFICRSPVMGESVAVDGRCGGAAQIFLGDAVFIDDARPDVVAAFPAYPRNYRGGWGFMLLTNMLPSQGNGSYSLSAYAMDRENHFYPLGSRTITCDNAHATRPFGAIDTPAQGGTVFGASYVNFGWALTPLPKFIPNDGSTMTVFVDGVAIGNPTYNNYRTDIATLFPGLNNTNGAIGFRVMDTTALVNGMHTIAWTVTDNQGSTEGIGSRYFRVSNGVGALTAAIEGEAQAAGAEARVRRIGRSQPRARTPGLGSGSAMAHFQSRQLGPRHRAQRRGQPDRAASRCTERPRRRIPAGWRDAGAVAGRLPARRGHGRIHVAARRRLCRKLRPRVRAPGRARCPRAAGRSRRPSSQGQRVCRTAGGD